MIHVNVWQKPLQYCKVISLQLIKNKWKKKKKASSNFIIQKCLSQGSGSHFSELWLSGKIELVAPLATPVFVEGEEPGFHQGQFKHTASSHSPSSHLLPFSSVLFW